MSPSRMKESLSLSDSPSVRRSTSGQAASDGGLVVPWIVALLTVSGLGAALYVGVPLLRDERASAEAARKEAAQAATRAIDAEQARRALEGRLRTLEDENRVLLEERTAMRELVNTETHAAEVEALRGAVEGKLGAEIKKGEAQLRNLPGGRLRVDLASSVLFAEGESALSLSGQQILMRLSSAFEAQGPTQVHVFGRSDAKESSGSSWGLAVNRAVSIVRFVSEKGALPAGRMVASGYGPKTESQEPGDIRRRIEILLTAGKPVQGSTVVEAPAAPPKPNKKKKR
jgi:chemotaxis protein MotB